MEKTTRQLEFLHAQRASAWIEALRCPDPENEAAFVAWLNESPRNVRDFLLMVTVDKALDGLDSKRQYDVESLLATVNRRVVPISQPPTGHFANSRPDRRWRFVAIAASLLVVLLAGWAMLMRGGSDWKEFETAIGEQRAFELDDGSIVDLNTHSRAAIRMGQRAREVRLLEGEALFRVRHDAARPFRVYTGDAVVQAVGTQFDVYKRADDTVVSVIEGHVKVIAGSSPAPPDSQDPSAIQPATSGQATSRDHAVRSLGASEEVRITRAGLMSVRAVADVSEAVAWRDRRLIFRQETLEHIAGEFNRYGRMQIRLEGAGVKSRIYTGVFDADDVDSLAQVLARDTALVVVRTDLAIVVRQR